MGNYCGKGCHPRLGDYSLGKALLTTRGADDIRRHYKIGKELGSGSFGQVRECTKRDTNETFAVKIIERKMTAKEKMIPGRPSNEQMMRSEVNILKMLDHPHIVKFVDFFEDRYFFYAVLELLAGGELFYRIVKRTKLTEQDASNFCKQMISALAYLHERQIVHRDIKAENFMYKDNSPDAVVKLIDFGMSTRIPESGYLTDLCGSPHYISPELIERHYGCSVDMWAFGVMLFLMLFGRYPFEGSKPALIAKEVQTKDIDWTAEECLHLTDSCIDFVSRLLDRNPKTRLTAAQALQHPWIASDSKLKELSVIKRENLELARRRSVKSEHQGNSRVAARVNSRMELAEREYLQGMLSERRVSFFEKRVSLSRQTSKRRVHSSLEVLREDGVSAEEKIYADTDPISLF